MEQTTLSVIILFIAALWIAAPGYAEIVDRVVAVVNGEVITLSMMEDAMSAIWTDTKELPESRQDALRRLIDRKLTLQEARRMGAEVVVSEEGVSQEVAETAARFASPEEFSRALKQRGITQKYLEKILMEEIMIEETVNRKFRLFVDVTDLEASEFFEQNKKKFVVLESVHLSQILFQLPPDADEAT